MLTSFKLLYAIYELFIKCYSKLYCMFLVIFKINQLAMNYLPNNMYQIFFLKQQQAWVLLP